MFLLLRKARGTLSCNRQNILVERSLSQQSDPSSLLSTVRPHLESSVESWNPSAKETWTHWKVSNRRLLR